MPQINLKHPAQPVADFSVNGAVVTIAGVTIDCAARESDEAQIIEIRAENGQAHEGGGGAILAQIEIPARRYVDAEATDADGNPTTIATPLPFDSNRVVITLWPAN